MPEGHRASRTRRRQSSVACGWTPRCVQISDLNSWPASITNLMMTRSLRGKRVVKTSVSSRSHNSLKPSQKLPDSPASTLYTKDDPESRTTQLAIVEGISKAPLSSGLAITLAHQGDLEANTQECPDPLSVGILSIPTVYVIIDLQPRLLKVTQPYDSEEYRTISN